MKECEYVEKDQGNEMGTVCFINILFYMCWEAVLNNTYFPCLDSRSPLQQSGNDGKFSKKKKNKSYIFSKCLVVEAEQSEQSEPNKYTHGTCVPDL